MGCPIPEEPEGFPYQAPVECGQPLIDITDMPRIHYGAAYCRMGLHGALSRCYVRREAALMLERVLKSLPGSYSLWIYDTLRPVEVQRSLYDMYYRQLAQDHPRASEAELAELIDDFVAYPRIDYARPTPHSTGGAIDLTLCKDGKLLSMGTEFDDLTAKAGTRYYERLTDLSEEEYVIRNNRRILYHAMSEAGFINYRNEWWHYAYGDRAWGHAVGRTPIYSYIEAPKN